LGHTTQLQAAQLLELERTLDGIRPDTIIVAGDFNSTLSPFDVGCACTDAPPSAPLQTMFGDTRWTDTLRSHLAPHARTYTRPPTGATWRRIDYVFTNVGSQYASCLPSPSDHFACIAATPLLPPQTIGRTPARISDAAVQAGGDRLVEEWACRWDAHPGSALDKWDTWKQTAVRLASTWMRRHPEDATSAQRFTDTVSTLDADAIDADKFADELDTAKAAMNEELKDAGKKQRMYFRKAWGKCSKLFFSALKVWSPPLPVRQLRVPAPNGGHTMHTEAAAIHDAVTGFYADLYAETTPRAPHAETRKWLRHSPRITTADYDILDATPSDEEIDRTVRTMPGWKAPGSDGMTMQAVKALHTKHPYIIRDVIREMWTANEWPESEREAVMVLIPKKAASTTEIGNLRPLSLTNVGYRILAKIAADRVAPMAPSLLPEGQVGFVAGRNLATNVHQIQNFLDCDIRHASALFVDFEKAYDSVPRWWVLEVLKARGFPASFRHVVRLMHTDTIAAVRVNGTVNNRFVTHRGVKQGCALAPILFALAIQPLMDRADRELQGVKLTSETIRYCAYADDIAFYLNGRSDCAGIEIILQEWDKVTGMRLSPSKSAIARPRRWWGSTMHTHDIRVTKGSISRLTGRNMYEYLGHMIARSPFVGARAEWGKVFAKMRNRVTRINACKCTMKQRALAAKFLLVSVAAYRASYLPINSTFEKMYASIVQKVLWRGARPRRPLDALSLPEVLGGLGVPTLRILAHARWMNATAISDLNGTASALRCAADRWIKQTTGDNTADIDNTTWTHDLGKPTWYVNGYRMRKELKIQHDEAFCIRDLVHRLASLQTPAWAHREPTTVQDDEPPGHFSLQDTTELRTHLLNTEHRAMNIVNGSDNRMWITARYRKRIKVSTSAACTLCGLHTETHILADTRCPVSRALWTHWKTEHAPFAPSMEARYAWALMVPTGKHTNLTMAAYETAARYRAAIWTARWELEKAADFQPPVFPGWDHNAEADIRNGWMKDTFEKMQKHIAPPSSKGKKKNMKKRPAPKHRQLPAPFRHYERIPTGTLGVGVAWLSTVVDATNSEGSESDKDEYDEWFC